MYLMSSKYKYRMKVIGVIHAFCDFCGKDCKCTATLLSITAIQNFARYHRHTDPYGVKEPTKSFIICHECSVKHDLPNPYIDYNEITEQEMSYKKTLPTRQINLDSCYYPKLPFSPGDTLYLIDPIAITSESYSSDPTNLETLELTVDSIHQYLDKGWQVMLHTDKSQVVWDAFEVSLEEYGKTLFKDIESARKRIKELRKR